MISVFSDGSSCGARKGPGGWGYVVVRNHNRVLACGHGGEPVSTNNIMELEAAIRGLNYVVGHKLHVGEEVELVSDSQYVLGLASGLSYPKKNVSQAMELRALMKLTAASSRWIPGHSGDPVNEQCDRLAKLGKSLYLASGPPKRRWK